MPPIHVRLRLLGGFQAELEDIPEQAVRISARKGQALLAYLAMRPDRRESRERLADLLWGDRSDNQARHSLRQCLVVLRRELQAAGADVLAIDGEHIALGPIAADALDFMQAAAAGDLQRAAALYHGEFLAGLTLEVEAFDEWVRLERGRLAGLAADTYARAAEAADVAGDGPRAIAVAERLVGLDPLREDSQRALLRLYARYRGRDAALAHAKTFAAMLHSELDVEPEAETAQLIDDVKQGVIPLARQAIQHPPAMPVGAATTARDMAGRPAESHPVQSGESGSRTPRDWRPSPLAMAAVAVAAIAVVTLMLMPWLLPEKGAQLSPSDARATAGPPDSAVAGDQWRSPGIYRGAAADSATLASAHRQALVVLPFAIDDPADKAAQALARHITTDLINDLSHQPTIRVISARTSQLYGGRPVDVASVGAELGVHYVVEGSVRREESRLHVNVALTDAKTRLQAWSQRFDRDLTERFAVQDEIVKGIARMLHVAVIVEEGHRKREESGAIGKLLAQGWAAIFRSNEAGGPRDAKTYFEAVLRTNPDHPSALTGLAAYNVLSLVFEVVADRRARIGQAEELLNRALEQKPRLGSAHYFLGLARKARGDLDGALESFTTAIEINPSNAAAYANAGHVLVRLGRFDEGLDHVRYAIRLSPKDPALASWQVFGGEAEIARGNDDAAIAWLTRALTLSPRRRFARALLGAAYALKGDAEEAAQQVAEWKRLVPSVASDSLMGTLGGNQHLSHRATNGLRLALGHSS